MNIAICDDNIKFIEAIEEYLDDFKSVDVKTDTFTNGESLLRVYEEGEANYDAIFLDIEMRGMNGIEVANRIREKDAHVIIVFVTAYPKYMPESFECMPFRFLVKAVTKEAFLKVCDEIAVKLKEMPDTFIFSENKSMVRVYSDDIVFFESMGHYIILHVRNGDVYKIRSSIAALLEKVDRKTFIRVHRGFVVNLKYVHKINDAKVYLHSVWDMVPLSRTYKQELANALIDFKERKYLL